MAKKSKKYVEALTKVDRTRLYDATEALALVTEIATAKFDETVEAHIKLGVDSRHADQQVRGAVILPNGTGKDVRVLVFAKGDKVAKWESSNTKVVKVNNAGKITATKKTGKATITVTTECGAKATLKVTVQKKAVKLTKLTVNKKKVTLKKGEKFALVVKKTPITAADKVTFKSSNKKVAKVSKKGVITTGSKTGKATITVKAGKKTVKVKVTVKKAAKKK